MDALPTPPPATPEEERKQRHLRICQRLIEMSLALTEAAFLRAHAELTAAPAPPPDGEPATRRPTDASLTYARLANTLRYAMAMETRISGGQAATDQPEQDPAKTYPAGEDLRGPILHPILRQAAADWPHVPDLAQKAAERLDMDLCIDLYGQYSASELLATISHDLGLQPDHTALSPELQSVLYPDGPPIFTRPWHPPKPRDTG